jgi:hypothetical protein
MSTMLVFLLEIQLLKVRPIARLLDSEASLAQIKINCRDNSAAEQLIDLSPKTTQAI